MNLSLLIAAAALQAAAVPQPVVMEHWRTAPVSAGSWTWRTIPGGSEALFQSPAGLQFTLRCNLSSRTVVLIRTGALPGAPVVVRTTSMERTLPASMTLGARDPLLDAMAFSRGRIAIEAGGVPRLILPSWPEPARAIEDCRK